MERATAGLRLPNDEAEGATTMRGLDSPSAAWALAFINRGIAYFCRLARCTKVISYLR